MTGNLDETDNPKLSTLLVEETEIRANGGGNMPKGSERPACEG